MDGSEIENKIKQNLFLKKIGNELIYGGHLIALSNCLIVLISIIILGNYNNIWILVLISYFITLIIYKADHLKELVSDDSSNPERAAHIGERISFHRASVVILFVLLFSLLYFTNQSTIIFCSSLLLMGIIYPKKITKYILAFKDFYAAFFWSSIIFLPYFYFSVNIGSAAILLFSFIFLRSVINMIFYDIKDITSDSRDGLKTLPVVFGKEKTIMILQYLNILAIVPLAYGLMNEYFPIFVVGLILSSIYSAIYLSRGKNQKESHIRKLSYIMVDGEAIFWVLILGLGKIITG